MAIKFPKRIGNANSDLDLLSREDASGSLNVFNGANLAHADVNTILFKQTSDKHTEAYVVFIIENSSATAGTYLSITDIKLKKDDGNGAFVTNVDSSDVIELDYLRLHSDGNPKTYTHTDGETKNMPYIGVQNSTGITQTVTVEGATGTEDVGDYLGATPITTDTADTSSEFFLKLHVTSEGVPTMVPVANSAASSVQARVPIFFASEIVADTTGIETGKYAAFIARVDVSGVAALATYNYELQISHDGIFANTDTGTYTIPITV